VRHLFSENAKSKGLGLNFDCDIDPRAQLTGDFFQLSLVLNNLISNAIKFTEHGSVDLSITRLELVNSTEILRFAVTDSGIGISQNAQEFIFEPFEQADGTISRRFGGTGLGLTIANRILGLMGTNLTFKSIEGQGSCFSFDLSLKLGHPGLR
jgi:signal transduction histidine kinase